MRLPKIATLLMFSGEAEDAIGFYVSHFDRSKVVSISRYESGEAGAEGSVKHAIFELCGETLMAIDSPVEQPFTFTPATSLFVSCEDHDEIERLFEVLSEDGEVLMELGTYGFSTKFGWVQDRFGVSWQLNLE